MRFASMDELVLLAGDTSPQFLKTSDGLTYSWHEQSPSRSDRGPLDHGYVTHQVTAYKGDERWGYLSVTHTCEALVQFLFPTPLHYKARTAGWAGVNLDADIVDQWCAAHRYAHICPASLERKGVRVPPHALSAEHVPSAEEAQADLDLLSTRFEREMKDWLNYAATPYVSYASVNEPVRGLGIGACMYELAAIELAKRGQVLRASTCRSDLALGLWAKLCADPRYKTSTTMVTNFISQESEVVPTLDYR